MNRNRFNLIVEAETKGLLTKEQVNNLIDKYVMKENEAKENGN